MINRTTIHYCKVVLPACRNCNSEIFSRLEAKVQNKSASDQDYYLWALKIRYCLSIIDLSLPNNRKSPDKGSILIKKFASIGHDFIKHAFTHLTADKFFFRPFPFGSVILLKNPCNDCDFGFVDVSHPYWGVTIALPDNRILAVLFTDRGLVKRAIMERYKSIGGLSVLSKGAEKDMPTKLFVQILTFRLLLLQYQITNIPYGVKLKDNGVHSRRLPNKLKFREKIRYPIVSEIADYCGLPQEVAKDVYERFPEYQKG